MSGFRSAARKLGVGRLAYRLFHAPKAFVRETARRGVLQSWRMARGRAAMVRAARSLRASPSTEHAPAVHFLTGQRFWFETAFCYVSLRRTAPDLPLRLTVYDDGTLTPDLIEQIQSTAPGATVVNRSEIDARLDRRLPVDRYPTLRRVRESYPHLRKLTDVHAGSTGWKLVLDSDMLFHRRPDELIHWLENPSAPLCMADCQNSYGYSVALMRSLAGREIPDLINVGVCGLRSESIDWDSVERWASALIATEGMSYYLEQALTAMIFAGGCQFLPRDEYIVRPSDEDIGLRRGKLQHYVAGSKTQYLIGAWSFV